MSEVRIYCGNCEHEIESTDVICPRCSHKLNEAGKHFKVSLSGSLSMSGELSNVLTKPEQKTVEKIWKWLAKQVNNFELSEFEIGFPSGVKVKFVKTKDVNGTVTKIK